MTNEAFEDARMLGLVAWLGEMTKLRRGPEEYILVGTENVEEYRPSTIVKMGIVGAAKHMLDAIDYNATEFHPYEKRPVYVVKAYDGSTDGVLATYRIEKESRPC